MLSEKRGSEGGIMEHSLVKEGFEEEAQHQTEEADPADQGGDSLLFETRWIRLKETKHGFHFAERAGRNSIALFLIQRCKGNEVRVLIRWQRAAYGEDRDKNYPAPITGSIDTPLSYAEHAAQEAYEEAGYRLQAEDLVLLGHCASSTQSNELCYLYACDITGRTPEVERERISWEPLSFLRTSCEYFSCHLGYFLLREMLSQQK
jgi:8-oxo-dGTP diphosphatase